MNASSCEAAARRSGRISAASMAPCRSAVALLMGSSCALMTLPSPSAHNANTYASSGSLLVS